MATTVAVVIPSRLSQGPDGAPYLQGALDSIRAQRCPGVAVHIVVALDPGLALPAAGADVTVLHAAEANQASAVNTGMDAAVAARADFIAHLEDDDLWRPHHLQSALDALAQHDADFVHSSSELFSDLPDGAAKTLHIASSGIFDFPIASTWVMKPEVWRAAGRYDPSFRVHPDNDWLGRVNALNRFRRVHLLEPGRHPPRRQWVLGVCKVAWIVPFPGGLSVRRRVQANSVLGRNAAAASEAEYGRIREKYGWIPW